MTFDIYSAQDIALMRCYMTRYVDAMAAAHAATLTQLPTSIVPTVLTKVKLTQKRAIARFIELLSAKVKVELGPSQQRVYDAAVVEGCRAVEGEEIASEEHATFQTAIERVVTNTGPSIFERELEAHISDLMRFFQEQRFKEQVNDTA